MTISNHLTSSEAAQKEGPKALAFSEGGYALPMVLMLVTILSLVAYSVLALVYFEQENALWDIARLKAEHASESGVICVASELASGSLSDSARNFSFYDGSRATVKVVPWGALYLVNSIGTFAKARSHRLATLGARPGEEFTTALRIGNTSHQIVLTGSASITGDVAVGQLGVTTGDLHGYSTPASLPIEGKILTSKSVSLPQVDFPRVNFLRDYYQSLLEHGACGVELRESDSASSLAALVPDTLATVRLPPGRVIQDSVSRPNERLYLFSGGQITIAYRARLSGLITIISSDSIVVESGAACSGCVLVAWRGIRVGAARLSSIQLLSPYITLGPGARASYPSVAISFPLDPAQASHEQITIKSGCEFEGFVALLTPNGEDILSLEKGCRVAGSVFSSARLTLDGDLIGTALAYDLYFYESPTMYLGWKRMGSINRRELPGGYLVAPLYAGTHQIAVLEWL